MARGKLRLYLGASPGVGKTFAMLNEGHRRFDRGTDVLIGIVETHGRPNTAAQIDNLPIIPRARVQHRGSWFEELDVDAIISRAPQVALIDELAHTNVPGSRHQKRWQDVDEILAAGIDVISTVNLQHLESVNDVVEAVTGVPQRETIPDAEVRKADQIELVDMAPEALRRRLAHGNIYPAERVDAALSNFFRPGNLSALRELALLWLANRVDDDLQAYRERHGIAGTWDTRERVAVALTGAPGGDNLIRRAARMAERSKGDLIGIHVRGDSGLATGDHYDLSPHRKLLEDLGGRFVEVVGTNIAMALVQAARSESSTQLVLGASRQKWWTRAWRGSIIAGAVKAGGGRLDVHVISSQVDSESDTTQTANLAASRSRLHRPTRRKLFTPIPLRRKVIGAVVLVTCFPAATALMVLARPHLHGDLSVPMDIELLLVIAVAAIGGSLEAAVAATIGFLLLNYYFAPPIHTFTISDVRDIVALGSFLATAAVVSALVDVAARRSLSAAQASTAAQALGRMAGRMLSVGEDPLADLLEELLLTFRQRGVAVMSRDDDSWQVLASAGSPVSEDPRRSSVVFPLNDDQRLVMDGPGLSGDDREILAGFAAQLAAAMESHELRASAAEMHELSRSNDLRNNLLASLSHDLRTPLASIKAAGTSLLDDDVQYSPHQTTALLETITGECDRLDNLVENLLDMNRVHTGHVQVSLQPTELSELVGDVIEAMGPRALLVKVTMPDGLPQPMADPVLLERVITTLIDNALVHGRPPPDRVGPSADGYVLATVEGGFVGDQVLVRVIDNGIGVPPEQRAHMFEPFGHGERSDISTTSGLGLGLAVAKGFVSAMGGELMVEDTPGGGCTLTVILPTGGDGVPS